MPERPPGTVIVPCQEQARYHAFTHCLNSLKLPTGSATVFAVSTSIVSNLNEAMAAMPPTSEWVWAIGDDHMFEPDTVLRLLDRDVDVIAPLCAQRGAPFALVHYDHEIQPGLKAIVQYDEIPLDGEPFQVHATGSALLIRRHVWETLGLPLYRQESEIRPNEDIDLCDRIREAGFDIYVDPEVQLGHIGSMAVWPRKHDGVWGTSLEFRHGYPIFLPGGIPEQQNVAPLELVNA